MQPIPIVTSIGSCRVYDPLVLLQRQGRVWLNQQNIYGYVHNSREVLQQFGILSGHIRPARRLLRFLNIRPEWPWRPPSPMTTLKTQFATTDCFVVEISSIRLLRFKAMYLQLNRTRELLVSDDALHSQWWTPLLREGENRLAAYPGEKLSEDNREVVEGVDCTEQGETELLRDLAAIRNLLPRPVLFVSHFNAGGRADGSIAQRQMISDTMRKAEHKLGVAIWDPTALVRAEGSRKALLDSSHYRKSFLPRVGEALLAKVEQVIRDAAAQPTKAVA